MRRILSLLIIALMPLSADIRFDICEEEGYSLMRDLAIVNQVNSHITNHLPATSNFFLQGGHLIMPSARMVPNGTIAFGYSSVPPYRNSNFSLQLLDHLELTTNYHVFRGVPDPVLSDFGYGDLSDRGVNVKIALLLPEDSDYQLPGLAFGFDDFTGTKSFHGKYLVLTQVFPKWDLEVTFGWGAWRLKGPFGGITWFPWHKCLDSYLKDLALVAEYDCSDYKDPEKERHPDGRKVNSRINIGFKYRLADMISFTAAWVRGREFAWGLSAFYDLGNSCGLIPKCDDPLPYCAPVNIEPLGELRTNEAFTAEIYHALCRLGMDLLDMRLVTDPCGRWVLRLVVWNKTYYCEWMVREHLENLFACLTPSNIDQVIIEMEMEGFTAQEYLFCRPFLEAYRKHCICGYELSVLSPIRNPTCSYPPECVLYESYRKPICFSLMPKTNFLFGSAKGKYKYTVGVTAGATGFLPGKIFYSFKSSYVFASNIPQTASYDILNPSQLINVHSDLLLYLKRKVLTIDEAYLQKSYHIGCGFYTRFAAGLFSQSYGGFAYELLYYPLGKDYAIGFEASWFRKRRFKGLAFFNKIRKLDGTTAKYVDFPGYQWFIDFYYNPHETCLDFKVSAGRFLAGDHGARFEVGRTFCSGLRVSIWYTLTDAQDRINGETYYDKGIAFSMPLDFFFKRSCRDQWSTSFAAWLRDCGFRAKNGHRLYDIIFSQRR